jgi:hypothetical protein
MTGVNFEEGSNIKIIPSDTILLEVLRYSSQSDSTLGLLSDITSLGKKEFLAYTIEDEKRDVKVMDETRIPAETYKVELRTVGGFNKRYLEKHGEDFHKGMLWIRNVPNFEYVLIHCGNTDDHTSGCLLVGDSAIQNINKDGFIGNSNDAYKRIYPRLANHLLEGGNVNITYVDADG